MQTQQIPDKLYFKIGEVSHITGLKPYVLRYWETEFHEISPLKSRTNQRLYKRKDVDLLLRIQHLLHEQRFTIDGARKKLKLESKASRKETAQLGLELEGKSNCSPELVKEIKKELKEFLADIEAQLKD